MIEDAASESATPSETPTGRRRPILLGMLLGLAIVLVALAAWMAANRSSTPRLTEAAFDAATQRWDKRGPASYDLDIELTGNRPGKIHVEVRDGQVTRMTRDGVQPAQERTWFYWSVPGMFDTIAEELEMARDPAAAFKSPAATQMVIWAEFDPQFGYPKKYDRSVLGTNYEIHWQVTRFEPLSAPK